MKCTRCNANLSFVGKCTQNSIRCPSCGANLKEANAVSLQNTQDVLCFISWQFGEDTLRDGNKLLAIFSDLAPQLKRERTLLTYFIQANGNTKLLDIRDEPFSEQQACFNKLLTYMTNQQMVAQSAAAHICESFALATGINIDAIPLNSDIAAEGKNSIRKPQEINAHNSKEEEFQTITQKTCGKSKKVTSRKKTVILLSIVVAICFVIALFWHSFEAQEQPPQLPFNENTTTQSTTMPPVLETTGKTAPTIPESFEPYRYGYGGLTSLEADLDGDGIIDPVSAYMNDEELKIVEISTSSFGDIHFATYDAFRPGGDLLGFDMGDHNLTLILTLYESMTSVYYHAFVYKTANGAFQQIDLDMENGLFTGCMDSSGTSWTIKTQTGIIFTGNTPSYYDPEVLKNDEIYSGLAQIEYSYNDATHNYDIITCSELYCLEYFKSHFAKLFTRYALEDGVIKPVEQWVTTS